MILRITRVAVVLYAAFILPTMVAWTMCWHQSSLTSRHPINWALVVGGIGGQVLHLALLVFLFLRWARGHWLPFEGVPILGEQSARSSYGLIGLLLVVTLLGSRAIGAGLTQGDLPAASFICDRCWTWEILWNGPRVTGCS